MSTTASAQFVQKFDWDDLYFQGGQLNSGAWLCGFHIRGNHRTHDDPHVEWDINIDQVTTGGDTAVGVSAGTFNVANKTRTGRSPITNFTFSIEHDDQVIPTHLFGKPNIDNAIRGAIDTDQAQKLFAAITDAKAITIALTFADNPPELLGFQYPADRGKFGIKNSYIEKCKRGRVERPRNPRVVP